MRRVAILSVLTAALSAAPGCSTVEYLVYKTGLMFTPPRKTKPLVKLNDSDVLLLVDVADQRLLSEYPMVRFRAGKAFHAELTERGAARRVVDPRKVLAYSQGDPDYVRKSAAEIGRHFGVDCVVQLVIQSHVLDKTLVGDRYGGESVVALRVIDAKANRQIFPDLEQFHVVEARTPTGISAQSRQEAEKVLLEGLARKVGHIFAAYEVEERPEHPEVQ